jgi:hypothetical protein
MEHEDKKKNGILSPKRERGRGRKTLYIKIKDGIHQKYKANESTSRHNLKKK